MFTKLLKLSDTLDALGHRQAADLIDKIVKNAIDEIKEEPGVIPSKDEFDYEPVTKVDTAPDLNTGVSKQHFDPDDPFELAKLLNFIAESIDKAEWTPEQHAEVSKAFHALKSKL